MAVRTRRLEHGCADDRKSRKPARWRSMPVTHHFDSRVCDEDPVARHCQALVGPAPSPSLATSLVSPRS